MGRKSSSTKPNNAGILKMVDFTRGDEDDLDELGRGNVKGPFRLIRAALPHLKATASHLLF